MILDFFSIFICSFSQILRILLCIHHRAGVRRQGLEQDGAPIQILQHCGPVCEKGSDSICDCFAVDVGGDIVAVIHRGMELWGVRVFRVSGCGRDCECVDCDGHQSRIVFAIVGGSSFTQRQEV